MTTTKFTDGFGSGINLTTSAGVWGDSPNFGVAGTSSGPAGVWGKSDAGEFGNGVVGVYSGLFGSGIRGALTDSTAIGAGVTGSSNGDAPGVLGRSIDGIGVRGMSDSATGVAGYSSDDYGVIGSGGNIGVFAENLASPQNVAYLGTSGLSADFYGNVFVHGHVTKTGGGFQIDHPLSPAKKFLQHSFVESSERKNFYDGVIHLDSKGEASIQLPDWFEKLNDTIRYQLTCIGRHAPVYISQELRNNRFRIAGGRPKMKVSWSVTGVRKDAWARANLLKVEFNKSTAERGYYLHPELYGKGDGANIRWARYGKPSRETRRSKRQITFERKPPSIKS